MLRGFGTVLSDLKAKAQALIGQLLMCRNTLNQLATSSDPAVKAQVASLIDQQTALEAELSDVNDQLNSGEDVSIADYGKIGLFLVKVKTQVDAVNNLAGHAAPSIVTAENVGIGAAIVAVVGLGIYFMTKKR